MPALDRPRRVPRTAPWGHQLRRKNSRIASTTATTIPWSTPSRIDPGARHQRHRRARSCASRSSGAGSPGPSATARRRSPPRPAPHCGRSASSELRNSSSTATSPAPTRPASWLLAPDCSATAVREPLVETAKPWKKPGGDVRGADADHLLVRASTSSPRRAAKLVAVAIVSVSETSVMPTAAISSGPTSRGVRPRQAAARGPPVAACPRSRRRGSASPNSAEATVAATTADEHRRHAPGDARQQRAAPRAPRAPTSERRGVRLAEAVRRTP